jgi:hypothetical protein
MAFLAGPWILAICLFLLTSFFYNPSSLMEIKEWFRISVLMGTITLAIAYAHVLILGVPVYFYFEKTNRLSYKNIIDAGFWAGFTGGVLFCSALFFSDGLRRIADTLMTDWLWAWFLAYAGWWLPMPSGLSAFDNI